MTDFDLDEVLDLEEEYYKAGYKEGQEISTREQYIEGKEYGYQTGYQRFLYVGYMKGLISYWRNHIDKYPKSVGPMLDNLEKLIDIPLSNGDEEVAIYECNIHKARNKLRVIASLCKEQGKINQLDEYVNEIAGKLQVQENVDEMW